ncbi:MAG TPA: prepilin-type N-terminal cleavage/methylation domain-containing protein [Bacilli bacterium]|nr:prepilin-type N-terminal cleavage/methylation domain-containing protein [Bacilli bacterium]
MSKSGPLLFVERIRSRLGISSDQTGFTLLELLLSLTILGLLLPVLAGWFTTLIRQWHTTSHRVEVRQQALVLLQRLETELHDAHSFTLQSNGLTFLNSQNQLIYYHHIPTSQLLLREVSTGGTSVLSGQVSQCQMALVNEGRTVQLHLTIRSERDSFTFDPIITGREALP